MRRKNLSADSEISFRDKLCVKKGFCRIREIIFRGRNCFLRELNFPAIFLTTDNTLIFYYDCTTCMKTVHSADDF